MFYLGLYHTGKCIRRFGGIYAYSRYFIDRKWYILVLILQSNFDGSNSSGPSVRVRPIHVFERYLA